jgi:hypothetical protein
MAPSPLTREEPPPEGYHEKPRGTTTQRVLSRPLSGGGYLTPEESPNRMDPAPEAEPTPAPTPIPTIQDWAHYSALILVKSLQR